MIFVVDSEDKINAEWLLKNFPEYKQVHHAIGGHNDGNNVETGTYYYRGGNVDYSKIFFVGMFMSTNDYSKDKLYDRDMKKFHIS